MPKPRLSVVEKPKGDTDDIRQGLEDMLRSVIAQWREEPGIFDIKTILSTIQYGGMFLTRYAKFPEEEAGGVGSTARKYSGAFRTNVARRGGAEPPADSDEPNF